MGGSDEGQEVPDDAIVLRGGLIVGPDGRLDQHAHKNLARVQQAYSINGLCATQGVGEPSAVARAGRSQHPQLRYARVADVRRIRFDVVVEPGHQPADALIVAPDGCEPEDWAKLERLLAENQPIDNPNRKQRGGNPS